MRLFHALFGPRLCKKHLVWRQNALICKECGRVAGFRYQIGDDTDNLRVFIFPSFDDQIDEIQQRPDTYKIVSANDVLGHVSFVDFATAITEMKESVSDITYHGFDGLGFYTPSETEEEFDDEESEFETDNDKNGFSDHDHSVDDVWNNGSDCVADVGG